MLTVPSTVVVHEVRVDLLKLGYALPSAAEVSQIACIGQLGHGSKCTETVIYITYESLRRQIHDCRLHLCIEIATGKRSVNEIRKWKLISISKVIGAYSFCNISTMSCSFIPFMYLGWSWKVRTISIIYSGKWMWYALWCITNVVGWQSLMGPLSHIFHKYWLNTYTNYSRNLSDLNILELLVLSLLKQLINVFNIRIRG